MSGSLPPVSHMDVEASKGRTSAGDDVNDEGAFHKIERVDVTVVAARHLPKKDTFGTCDGYAVCEMGGMRRQTTTITNSYSPEWKEVFTFMVPQGSQEPLMVRIYDWDRIGQHDFIGLVEVPPSARGQEGDLVLPVLDGEGKPVVGHDKKPTELVLRIKTAQLEKSVDFQVQVKRGSNMPKADMFGSCDPYIKLEFGERHDTTSVENDTFHPTWNQTFGFSVMDPSAQAGDLVLILMDKDRMKKDDELGRAVVPATDVSLALSSAPGYERELVLSFTAAKGGVPLIGHSGEPTTVVIRLIIGAGCGTDPSLDSANFLLEICVDSARHLPQKDFLFGSCDPFVSVEFARQAYKTETKKRTLDPTFEQIFVFSLDSRHSCGEAMFEIYDWDRMSKNDLIGWSSLPQEVVSALLARGAGSSQVMTLPVYEECKDRGAGGGGRTRVMGADKQAAELILRLVVSRAKADEVEEESGEAAEEGVKEEEAREVCRHGGDKASCEACARVRGALGWLEASSADRGAMALKGRDRLGPEVVEQRAEWSKSARAVTQWRGEGMAEAKAKREEWLVGPGWGNGEVLVGRDVVPCVGMRVLMSRQHRQWLHDTGLEDPSRGAGGTIIRLLAGNQKVGSSSMTRESWGNGNGMSCKVTWDEEGRQTRHALGLQGQFELITYESSAPLRPPRVREIAVQGAVGWRRPDAMRTTE